MVRLAQKEDLQAISAVHSACFPNSYMTQLNNASLLGGGILSDFYGFYYKDVPELFYVACDNDNNIVGFCMGYYMDKATQMQRFLKENKIKIAIVSLWLIIKCNKIVWSKVLNRLRHKPGVTDWEIVNQKYEHITNEKRGDLLSVCVLPAYRGQGYAQQLMDAFLRALIQNDKILCLLSVKAENERARKYYERNGFEVYRTRRGEGLTYIKPLTNGSNNVST